MKKFGKHLGKFLDEEPKSGQKDHQEKRGGNQGN